MGNIKSMSKINGYSQIKQEPHKTNQKLSPLAEICSRCLKELSSNVETKWVNRFKVVQNPGIHKIQL